MQTILGLFSSTAVVCIAFAFVTIKGMLRFDTDRQNVEFKNGTGLPPGRMLDPENRIAHGKVAKRREDHAFLVALFERPKTQWNHFCGGTLIRLDVILTACHCLVYAKGTSIEQPFHKRTTKDVKALLGTDNLNDFSAALANKVHDDIHQVRTAKKIVVHPLCFRSDNTMESDVGLIQVWKAFTLKPKFISLAHTTAFDGLRKITLMSEANASCTAMGWGYDENQESPTQLMEIPMHLRPGRWCKKEIEELTKNEEDGIDNFIASVQICAVADENQGICQGDSGGPLVCKCPCDYQRIVGVVSWSSGESYCSYENAPTVFARIDVIDEWIPWVIRKDFSCKSRASYYPCSIHTVIAVQIILYFLWCRLVCLSK